MSRSKTLVPKHLIPRLKGQVIRGVQEALAIAGHGLTKLELTGLQAQQETSLQADPQQRILERHDQQTIADVEALNEKYRLPVFGSVRPMDLLRMLGECLDPTDNLLGCVSQLTNSL